jgi:hypothetical protein
MKNYQKDNRKKIGIFYASLVAFVILLTSWSSIFLTFSSRPILAKIVSRHPYYKGGGYDYQYSFHVNGEEYEGRILEDDYLKIGDRIWVRYSPISPSINSECFSLNLDCEIFYEKDSISLFEKYYLEK